MNFFDDLKKQGDDFAKGKVLLSQQRDEFIAECQHLMQEIEDWMEEGVRNCDIALDP